MKCVQFVRTVSAYKTKGLVVYQLFKQFGWKRCALITSTQDVFLNAATSWQEQLSTKGISVVSFNTFAPGSFKSDIFKEIRRTVRVVAPLALEADMITIALKAQVHARVRVQCCTHPHMDPCTHSRPHCTQSAGMHAFAYVWTRHMDGPMRVRGHANMPATPSNFPCRRRVGHGLALKSRTSRTK